MGRKTRESAAPDAHRPRGAQPPAAAAPKAPAASATRGWRPLALAGIAVIAVLAGVLVWRGAFARPPATPAAADLSAVQTFAYVGNQHTTGPDVPVAYAEVPPVGGEHAPPPYWLNCGIYDRPVANESAVHSLEHG
ncbi:MAG: DUF3105 domain-containing protein, partial [Thermomicrobiales bacterium]|nr:DUF3105 domain-containing protein [Thermomicrobiales bacterium]